MSEPGVADDGGLGRLAELDYQAWVDAFAGSPNVTVVRTDDVRYRTSPVPNDYLNGVFGTWFRPETTDARISEVIAAIAGDGRPFIWTVWPSDTPDDLRTRLLAAGFEDDGSGPVMATELADVDLDADRPAGLVIEPARTAADIAAVTTFLFAPTDGPDPGGAVCARTLQRFAAGPEPTLRLFAGRVDGEIVATSGLSTLTGVAGIYAVTTAEAWRGRGFGRALTLAAMRAGAEAGMRTSVLLASELGQPVYRRIGFREVGDVAFLRWPGRTRERS